MCHLRARMPVWRVIRSSSVYMYVCIYLINVYILYIYTLYVDIIFIDILFIDIFVSTARTDASLASDTIQLIHNVCIYFMNVYTLYTDILYKHISCIDVLFIDMYVYVSPARTDARLASDRVQLPRFRLRLFHPDKHLYMYTCIYNSFMFAHIRTCIHTYIFSMYRFGLFHPNKHLYMYMCTYNSYIFAHISTCTHI